MNIQRDGLPKHPYDVRVDRTSCLGNPDYLHKCVKNPTAERNRVCDNYIIWFDEQLRQKNPKVIKELKRLRYLHNKYKKLRLFCWCTPKRCHIRTIKKYLESIEV